MALERFNIAALPTIDSGRIGTAFDLALQRLVDDCRDRAADKRARKLTLTVTLQPHADEKGNLRGVDVAFDIGESIPKRRSQEYSMEATRAGLLFNELSPDDVHQMTIDELKPRRLSDEAPESGHRAAVND